MCPVEIPAENGGHEGADVNLMKSLFNGNCQDFQQATARDGYWSLAVAIAANQSIESGKTVEVSDYQ